MRLPIFFSIVMSTLAAIWPGAVSGQPKSAGPADQAELIGEFGHWKAYKVMPSGKKFCFALSEPTSAVTDPPGRNRDPSYAFVSTRPADDIKNEISIVVGYPQKTDQDATATIGAASFALFTLNNGAWIKDQNEQPQMVDAMRKGAELIIKSESSRGTKTTDTYSLKGIAQALDKIAEECR